MEFFMDTKNVKGFFLLLKKENAFLVWKLFCWTNREIFAAPMQICIGEELSGEKFGFFDRKLCWCQVVLRLGVRIFQYEFGFLPPFLTKQKAAYHTNIQFLFRNKLICLRKKAPHTFCFNSKGQKLNLFIVQ
jgi:hypothetical protein